MDARMQKHRMTRWVGRCLALLSLAMSCRVRVADLLGSSGKRSEDSNNIFALGNVVRALFGLLLSSVSAQACAAWDAGAAGCFTSFQTAMEAVCAINNPDSTSIPGSVYYRDSCVMTSIPNFRVYAHAVDLATGNSFSFAYTSSLTQCDFTITLSGGSSVEPWHKKHDQDHQTSNLSFTASVTGSTGQVVPNVEVTITTDATQNSGGHVHTNARPKGRLLAKPAPVSTKDGKETITGNTDSNGVFSFTFGAEEASGKHTLTAICNGCKGPATSTVNVLIPNLALLEWGADPTRFELRGDKTWHPDNHYFSGTALLKIVDLAYTFSMKTKNNFGVPLKINDSSLERGGVLDLGQDWTYKPNGHQGHRTGIVVDINNFTQKSPRFKELAARLGIDAQWHYKGTAPHYHLLLLGNGRDE